MQKRQAGRRRSRGREKNRGELRGWVLTSSTAFSRARSERRRALISACASPSSFSLSASTKSVQLQDGILLRQRGREIWKKRRTDRIGNGEGELTVEVVLEAGELDADGIGAVEQADEVLHLQRRLQPGPLLLRRRRLLLVLMTPQRPAVAVRIGHGRRQSQPQSRHQCACAVLCCACGGAVRERRVCVNGGQVT